MHIPDGYLGPQTYLPAWGVMAPVWSWASARVKRTLRRRQLPMMALAAAFTFVVMMFNVPLPGGTSGHAVGSVLVAVLLGPWAAVVAVSLALAVQALLFGDGGITALGANCLTMAVIMPFVGWSAYRLLAGRGDSTPRRRALAAGMAGYVGVNAAALTAGVLLGLQPLVAHDAGGQPLYCPFGLAVAVPAMALPHLLVIGFVEAAVTGLGLAYLMRTDPELPIAAGPGAGERTLRPLAVAVAAQRRARRRAAAIQGVAPPEPFLVSMRRTRRATAAMAATPNAAETPYQRACDAIGAASPPGGP